MFNYNLNLFPMKMSASSTNSKGLRGWRWRRVVDPPKGLSLRCSGEEVIGIVPIVVVNAFGGVCRNVVGLKRLPFWDLPKVTLFVMNFKLTFCKRWELEKKQK